MKSYPDVASKIPSFFTSPRWSFVPFFLLLIGGGFWATERTMSAIRLKNQPIPIVSPHIDLAPKKAIPKKKPITTPIEPIGRVESHNQSGGVTAGNIGALINTPALTFVNPEK